MPSLGELLVKSAIKLNLPAKDAREVVTVLGEELFAAGYVKESFIEAALTREETMPTGLPLSGQTNAAIPHTDIEHVLKPGVAMATLQSPVTFQNMADPQSSVDVQLVFLLALDKPKAQIEMLQEIASILQKPEIISQLMQAKTQEDVAKILVSLV